MWLPYEYSFWIAVILIVLVAALWRVQHRGVQIA
ncbi:MAG: hypothetical protein JWN39_2875, partial [Ilumatobacteraceae bacterium]|nr:hypothetical protein [Ilumatobacteraceae bacterium]